MNRIALPSIAVVGALLALSLQATPARSIPITFVSSSGSGVLCTQAAPCGNFLFAHAATDPGGEIHCIDAGEYGAVLISKAISIICDNTMATITTGVTGISISAGPDDVVTLRGLNIEGLNASSRGILFNTGAALNVQKVQIRGFRGASGAGILFTPNAYAELYVADSDISDNGISSTSGGIVIRPTSTASVNSFIERVRLENNTVGLVVDGRSSTGVAVNTSVLNSAIVGSANDGINALTTAGFAGVNVFVDHCIASGNFSAGIIANGPTVIVRIGDSSIALNVTGVAATNGGTVHSFKNNRISGNLSDGTPLTAFPGPGGSAQQ